MDGTSTNDECRQDTLNWALIRGKITLPDKHLSRYSGRFLRSARKCLSDEIGSVLE